jgi:hypothetical protein
MIHLTNKLQTAARHFGCAAGLALVLSFFSSPVAAAPLEPIPLWPAALLVREELLQRTSRR